MSDTLATVEGLAAVAEEAAGAAATYLRERFEDGSLEATYTAMDVKTAADVGAEERILDVVRESYPNHAIASEEAGELPGDGPYRWVVDPLDGTNNFAIGSPTFAVGVTAVAVDVPDLPPGTPVAAAVHVPVTGERYVATRGGGVRCNGERVEAEDGDAVPLSHATVGVIIGSAVLNSPALQDDHAAITDAVEGECKRAIQTWAPLVYWGLLARGRLDGFVCFHPDEREQAAGALLAREAGCIERGEGPLTVFAIDEATADVLRERARNATE